MANENSGILDANALFADLPWIASGPASSVPPPMPAVAPTALPQRRVVIVDATAFATPRRRRDETTARSRRPVDPVRAQLIAVIVCGLIALAATLVACFFYVTAPPSTHARDARPAMTAAR
jgi:hypothetical protein